MYSSVSVRLPAKFQLLSEFIMGHALKKDNFRFWFLLVTIMALRGLHLRFSCSSCKVECQSLPCTYQGCRRRRTLSFLWRYNGCMRCTSLTILLRPYL